MGATTDGPDFVSPADRVATFDNDGTLWVEQPLPPQFDFVFGKWAEEIRADPSLAAQQPYKAIIEKDPSFFAGIATQDAEVVGRSWKPSLDRGQAARRRSSKRKCVCGVRR